MDELGRAGNLTLVAIRGLGRYGPVWEIPSLLCRFGCLGGTEAVCGCMPCSDWPVPVVDFPVRV